jgi:hypothetical protein
MGIRRKHVSLFNAAERAFSRATITQDKKRGGPVIKTLSHIGTKGLAADRVKIHFFNDLFQLPKIIPYPEPRLQPGGTWFFHGYVFSNK